MTTLTDFAPEELAILNRTPTSVAMGAAYADQDGAFSLAKEMRAGLTAAREAAFAFPQNEIIQLLAESMQEIDDEDEQDSRREERERSDEAEEDVVEERNPVTAGAASLELAAQAMAIMESTATLEETVQFKHWLYAVAEQVTLASKTGGFLGIGGTQVGEGEKAYLAQLREVLNMPEESTE